MALASRQKGSRGSVCAIPQGLLTMKIHSLQGRAEAKEQDGPSLV